MTEQQLLQAKRKVDEAKTRVSELKGQQNALLNQLKNDYKLKNLEELKTYIKTENVKLDKISAQIERGLQELEKYNLD
ncbi:MAG: hypothetical protein WC554_07750 [Clostridia bacterium]